MGKLADLPPESQRRVLDLFFEFMQLPPGERRHLGEALEKLVGPGIDFDSIADEFNAFRKERAN